MRDNDNRASIGFDDSEAIWMPAGHERKAIKYRRKLPLLDQFLDAVRRAGHPQRMAVQAGGHVGLFPQRLAADYAHVLTFEPDVANMRALTRNVDAANVHAIRGALSDATAFGAHALHHNARNSGGHWIKDAETGASPIASFALDSFDLASLDALILDCEGAEYLTLNGARETIMAHRPPMLIEHRGHGEGKVGGSTDVDLRILLDHLGYEPGASYGHDVAWWPL